MISSEQKTENKKVYGRAHLVWEGRTSSPETKECGMQLTFLIKGKERGWRVRKNGQGPGGVAMNEGTGFYR